MPPVIFRRGLDARAAVAGLLAGDYHSHLVEQIKADDYRYRAGRLEVVLAREFGFCYGVDRAVEYAYQAGHRFPGRRIFLTGEIIHNPHVNQRLREKGIRFLSEWPEWRGGLTDDDVVILPAFGVEVAALAELEGTGCTLVDTTCGSVLNVWKNVRRYAQDGFTSIIHGKLHHEETRATASQAVRVPGGHYLVLLDRDEAELVCGFVRDGRDPGPLMARLARAASPGFDPRRHLERIGLANQTTMLMSESLAIAEMLRQAYLDRHGEAGLADRFRAFETICSATEDRQVAVLELLDRQRLDLMVVIGGFNSSNTANLARICAARLPTFHIADTNGLVSPDEIVHRPVGGAGPATSFGWLPRTGDVVVGLTAGASTPDVIVGEVVERLASLASGRAGADPAR